MERAPSRAKLPQEAMSLQFTNGLSRDLFLMKHRQDPESSSQDVTSRVILGWCRTAARFFRASSKHLRREKRVLTRSVVVAILTRQV